VKTFRIGCGLLILCGSSWPQQYVISTIAGGAPPPTPGPPLTVSIGFPRAVATDNAGNMYFTGLNCVFRPGQDGVLVRVAGNSRAGHSGDGGAAANAQLSNPSGLAVAGN
jgi:hypothetical protein